MIPVALQPFARQILLGLAIFAAVLAASLPLALVDERLALGAAVGVGSVMAALLARRLRIALVVATLLAVLGAFGSVHSIHLARHPAPETQRAAALAPGSGIGTAVPRSRDRGTARAGAYPVALVLPARAETVRADGSRIALPLPAGWALPAALFLFWGFGYVLIAAGRYAARRLDRALDAAG